MNKNILTFVVGLCLLISLIATTGCKTTVVNNPDGTVVTNKVINAQMTAKIIRSVVPVGVQIAVIKETNSIPYFQAAVVAIDALAYSGVYDPIKLQEALTSLKIDSQDALLAIQAGLSIYKSFAAEAVTAKLNDTEYLVVLIALSDSIKQGLVFSAIPSSEANSIQVKIKK